MYYRLKDNILLRGWKKLPYAILNKDTGLAAFMNGEQFAAISFCTGTMREDCGLIFPHQKAIIEEFVKNAVVEKIENPKPLNKEQEYVEYPSRYVRSAHWSITGKCNYKCKHCFMSAPHAKYGELSHEHCVRIINQLAQCGVQSISLTGGECLVRKDFFELVDLLVSKGIDIYSIYSNGWLVNEKLLDKLSERALHPEFNMSFDGVGEHDWLRGVEGAEEAVIKAFKLCRDKGFPTASEFCIHKKNAHTLRESVNLLGSVGCKSVKVSQVMATGEWEKNNFGQYTMTMKETYDAFLEYIPYYYEDKKPLELMLGGMFFASPKFAGYMIPGQKCKPEVDASNYCMCGHARNNLYITAEGRMAPCMPLSGSDALLEKLPNLCEKNLSDALDDSYYMDLVNARLSEYLSHNSSCAECQWKNACLAGCRGCAMSDTGDYFGVDKGACLLFKGGYRDKVISLMEKIAPCEKLMQ